MPSAQVVAVVDVGVGCRGRLAARLVEELLCLVDAGRATILQWQQRPGREVGDPADLGEDGQQDESDPDDGGVDAEAAGEPARDATEELVRALAGEGSVHVPNSCGGCASLPSVTALTAPARITDPTPRV